MYNAPNTPYEYTGGSAATVDKGNINIHLTVVYDALSLFGFLSLFVIFCTAWFSSHIHRSPTWFLYIFSWMLYSLCLLLNVGHQSTTAPSFSVCLTQAVAIYANPALVATSSTVFLLQIFLVLRRGFSLRYTRTLLAVPIAVFFLVAMEVLVVGLTYRDRVERDVSRMFCHISNPLPSRISAAIVLVLLTVVLPVSSAICRALYLNKDLVRDRLNEENSAYSVSLVFRVVLFGCIPLVASGIGLAELLPPRKEHLPALNVLLALLPAMAGLTFGSQKDILSALIFRRAKFQESSK